MADGFLSGLARHAADWRAEAEERAAPHARRAGRHGKAALDELRELWDRIESLVEQDVAPATADYARSASEKASDYVRSAGNAGRSAYRQARHAVRDYGPQARDAAGHAAGYLRDVTRQRPLLAIGVAIAGTWLVASLLNSDRRR